MAQNEYSSSGQRSAVIKSYVKILPTSGRFANENTQSLMLMETVAILRKQQINMR